MTAEDQPPPCEGISLHCVVGDHPYILLSEHEVFCDSFGLDVKMASSILIFRQVGKIKKLYFSHCFPREKI